MAETTIERSYTCVLKLTEQEARGLYTLLNWGVSVETASTLNLVEIAHSLNKSDVKEGLRNPYFAVKASFTA